MSDFLMILFLLCIGVYVASVIWLLVAAITRRKKNLPITIGFWAAGIAFLLLIAGVSTVPDEPEEEVVQKSEYDALMESYEIISENYDNLSKERESVAAELENVYSEYNQYKESMSQYEGLAAAEAESRRIEAERVAESQRAYEESVAAAEAASREAEEKAGYDTGITYDQLARRPDDYEGEKVKFTGKVIQVLEGDAINNIRFAVNSNYDTLLLCKYNKNIVESRVLEDDVITIYGTSGGLFTYESVAGTSITLPLVYIEKIEY